MNKNTPDNILRNSIVDFQYMSAEEALNNIVRVCGIETVINYLIQQYGDEFVFMNIKTIVDKDNPTV